jgi:beta-galactosidase
MAPRTVARINRDWLYEPEPVVPGLESELPAGLERVALPHTTAVLPAQGFDDADFQTVSTYRRRLRLPADARDGRVVVEFGAVMTAATVYCNGVRLREHLGGFVPFTVELTDALRCDGADVLTVEVDSTERPDVPPFGGHIDYLTFGGIYRDVTLSLLPATAVADVFAKPVDVLGPDRRIEVTCALDTRRPPGAGLQLEAELRDGDQVVATATAEVGPDAWEGGCATATAVLRGLDGLRLWDIDDPALYRVVVRLRDGGQVLDETAVRTGLRDARFTDEGFLLNGRRITLRGLNRHQTYPHLGAAMPARGQRRDAEVLRHQLKCNAVRTSHYPQDPSFLDACDELGLLVFEEMPGWQHIGDAAWQDLACRDVEAMVVRDRNHPSIVLWGVRVNESFDDTDFYTRTNAIAHRLDDSRQTSGVRYFRESELLEDVFALNDFQTGGPLHPPHHPRYLVSEYAGHMFPTKRFDNVQRVQEHALLHARVLDGLHADPGIAGGFGWCAFDYATHAEFGSGNRICYHGVADSFRVPKVAADVYRAQCDPAEEVVLEPAFTWAAGDHSDYGGPGVGLISSNCDRVLAYVDGEPAADMLPDREHYPHLPHAPFFFDQTSGIAPWRRSWGDLRLEGYRDGERVITRTFSGRGVDADLRVEVDDPALVADGADTTRVLIRVTDEFGNGRPFAAGAVTIDVEGPLTLVGESPAALVGGVAAAWLRATAEPGSAVVRVTHQYLGVRRVEVELRKAQEEPW